MIHQNCPQTMVLEKLLLGCLQEDEAQGLEQHLEGCPRCAAKAQTLRPNDTLLDAMRQYQPPATDDSALAKRMVERLGPRADGSDEAGLAGGDAAEPEGVDDESRHDLFSRLAKVIRPPESQPPQSPAPAKRPPTATPDDPDQYDFLAPPEAADEIGRLGNYRVLSVLGSGGMGVVFLAEDRDLKRRVALKAMHPALAASASARERFQREAQAVAAINHDHVVAIHQVGKDRGIPFLAMALLRGQSLDDRLVPGRPLPLADILRIGRETAAGLAAAHERGLIHRDVKPANVWLEEPGGRVKLLDFGLARPVDSDTHFTRLGAVIGTPAFMSPEQSKGQSLDPRSDLFSLGSMLYLMSTGEPPFVGGDHAAVLAAIDKEEPLPPHRLRPELPAAFSDLVMQMLAKPRDARPASAAAVVSRLREIEQRAEPAPAAAAPPPLRPQSFWWLGGIAAAVLLLLGGGFYAATVIVAEWTNGKLIIETDDKNVEVVVKQEGGQPLVEIVERGTQRVYSLRPGDYEIDVTVQDGKAKTQFFTRKLTLTQGDRRVVDVRLELAQAAPPAVAPPPAVAAANPPAIPSHEPPPLAQWLHTRKVITVAQDGRGDFKSIPEALQASADGQVIKLLDRGPYQLPAEVIFKSGGGLVSEVGTRVELSDWVRGKEPENARRYRALQLMCPAGMRLAGLQFEPRELPQDADAPWTLGIQGAGEIVIEGCRVRTSSQGSLAIPTPGDTPSVLISTYFEAWPGELPTRVWLRENLLEGSVDFNHGHRFEQIVLERNILLGGGSGGIRIPPLLGQLALRHNLLLGHTGAWFFFDPQGKSQDNRYLVANNVFQVQHSPICCLPLSGETAISLPPRNVTIENNVFQSQRGKGVDFFQKRDNRASAAQHWRVGHNVYARRPGGTEVDSLELAGSDQIVEQPFLSLDATKRDYLRIAAEGPLAASGAGGDLPGYVGLVPPGPAPMAEDWLSRLLAAGAWQSPAVVEPPPLAQWLQGRKIITVAQDGSGDFKTINAALDALQPGQVVKVLDKGPYREAIQRILPVDVGLVSEVGTRIEIPDWIVVAPGNEDSNVSGCRLRCSRGLRLHGFEFATPGLKGKVPSANGLELQPAGDVVVNACRVLRSPEFAANCFTSIYCLPPVANQEFRLFIVENDLEGGIEFGRTAGTVQIVRNLIRSAQFHGVILPISSGEVVVSGNIIEAQEGGISMMASVDIAAAPGPRISITNNSIDCQQNAVGFWSDPWSKETSPIRNVRIENNIMRSKTGAGINAHEPKLFDQARNAWITGHNCYRIAPGPNLFGHRAFPLQPTDLVDASPFVSTEPSKRGYYRIATKSKLATSGAGGDLPKHIGPLLPGLGPLAGDWLTRLRERAAADKLPPLGAVRTYLGHAAQVNRAAFTADGRRFLTGDAHGLICLWDALSDDASEILTFHHETGGVWGLACSPDGRFAVSGQGPFLKDGQWVFPSEYDSRMWDLQTGELIGRFEGNSGRCDCVRFFPDGKSLLSTGTFGVVSRWDVASRKQRQRYEGGTGVAAQAAVSPDGSFVAANRGTEIHVWDAVKGDRLATFRGHASVPCAIAISSDGTLVASGTDHEKTIRVWKAKTGEEVAALEHPNICWSVAFHPKLPSVLLAGCDDGAVFVWDVSSKRTWYRFSGHSPNLGILALAVSPDGRLVVSGGSDQSVRLWRLPEKYPQVIAKEERSFAGNEGSAASAVITPDGKRIVTCCDDRSVRVWNLETGEQEHRFDSHKEIVWRVAISPDGRYAASGGGGKVGDQPDAWDRGTDNEIRLWDLAEGKEVRRFRGHTDMVYTLTFSPDSKRLLSGGGKHDPTVRLWDVETGEQLQSIDGGAWITKVAFHRDGRLIAWSSYLRKLCLYDLEAKQPVREFPAAHEVGVNSVGFSTNGDKLVTAGNDNLIHVWDAATGERLRTISGHYGHVWSACFTSDDRRIVSASLDGTARVWDAETGVELQRIFTCDLWGAVLAPDNRRVLTFGRDAVPRLWPLDTEPSP